MVITSGRTHKVRKELDVLTNVNAQGHEEAGAADAHALAQPGLGGRGPARRQSAAVPAAAGAGMVYFHSFTWVIRAVRFGWVKWPIEKRVLSLWLPAQLFL